MKNALKSIPDLLLNILYIQPHIHFFLLVLRPEFTGVFLSIPVNFPSALFQTLLFDIRYCVIDLFRAHSPELYYVFLVSCLRPYIFHLGYLLFEVIVRICHNYPSLSLPLSKEVESSLFI